MINKPTHHKSTFRLEIAFVLALKLIMLFCIWAFFVKGQTTVLDHPAINHRLFSESP